MGTGLHPNTADDMLDDVGSTVYWQMHVGDPGPTGTANQSAVTSRQAVTLGAASGGVKSMSGGTPTHTATAAETITHGSFWDAATDGNVKFTGVMSTPRTLAISDDLVLNSLTVSIPGTALMS